MASASAIRALARGEGRARQGRAVATGEGRGFATAGYRVTAPTNEARLVVGHAFRSIFSHNAAALDGGRAHGLRPGEAQHGGAPSGGAGAISGRGEGGRARASVAETVSGNGRPGAPQETTKPLIPTHGSRFRVVPAPFMKGKSCRERSSPTPIQNKHPRRAAVRMGAVRRDAACRREVGS